MTWLRAGLDLEADREWPTHQYASARSIDAKCALLIGTKLIDSPAQLG